MEVGGGGTCWVRNKASGHREFMALRHRGFWHLEGSRPMADAAAFGNHFVSENNHCNRLICRKGSTGGLEFIQTLAGIGLFMSAFGDGIVACSWRVGDVGSIPAKHVGSVIKPAKLKLISQPSKHTKKAELEI